MSRGTSNSETGGFKYLSFMAGKFVQRVPEGTKGAEPRELKKGPKMGTIIHELKFDKLGGQILNVETETSEYGQQLHIYLDVSTIEEPDSKIKLSLSLSSGPAKGFLSRLPVINFAEDVELRGFHIEKKDKPGKFGTYLVPYQNGQKLISFYSREEPKGLPQMVQIKVKGVPTWDDTDQLEFFQALIKNTKFPEESEEPAVAPTPEAEIDDSDLPF